MKRFGFLATLMLVLCIGVSAQVQPLTQTWTESITLAPPAIVNSQTFSNTTGTGVQTLTTGGSIAAGAYRCGVTLFTATNTETPLSTDTAATAVITTTGTTSTVIIQPPTTVGAGPNVVGWRPYCGVSGGAAAAETLVVINNTVCGLSTSSTPSCALTSPATLTLQSQFAAGSGGPATPGTAVYPQIANAANQAIFENSQYQYHVVYWVVSGTAPSACTFTFQNGATVAGLANVAAGSGGQTVTCTSSGSFALPAATVSAFTSINLATFTAGDTTTKVAFYETSLPFNPTGSLYFGNAVPSSTCATGTAFINTAGGVSTTAYTCSAGTWTAVTVP
jgi:hypothetical protein